MYVCDVFIKYKVSCIVKNNYTLHIGGFFK